MQETENMKIEEPTSDNTQEIPTTRIHECSDGKTRNEEQYQAWKNKKAQFDKDPDMFCHVDDIVMGVVEGPRGRAVVFGHHPIGSCKEALVTLQHRFFNALSEFEFKMEMKNAEKALVDANGKAINTPKPSGIIS